jgi:hypothetical protein
MVGPSELIFYNHGAALCVSRENVDPKIADLITVPVRTVWPLEDKDFTPWLAKDQNLELLSEILQLGELEVEGTEVATDRLTVQNQRSFGPTQRKLLT